MSAPLITLNNVTASYNGKPVLKDISFTIAQEDFTGIIGPNGGGKTTLLKVILGLLKPVSGKVNRFLGKNDIGYLPQFNHFDDHFPISVTDVVLSGLAEGFSIRSKIDAPTRDKVNKIMKDIGISNIKNRPVGELSGGELQRTMLARAIISSPKLLILDEPNTYVDNRFEFELYRTLQELNKKMAILLVSHDIGTISPYIKSIACVNMGLHFHPSNEITQEQLNIYNCPIELVTHGPVPHRVMGDHTHK